MRDKNLRPRWMEFAFVALWVNSFIFFWKDVSAWTWPMNAAFDMDHLVAWTYLIVAMLIAKLYHKPWGKPTTRSESEHWAGIGMALAVGVGGWLSFLAPSAPFQSIAIIAIIAAVSAALLAIAYWQTSRLPLIASGLLMFLSHFRLWQSPLDGAAWWIPTFMASILGGLSYVMAHQATRSHESDPAPAHLAAILTPIWMALVVISGVICGWHTHSEGYQTGGYILFLVAGMLASIGSRQLLAPRPSSCLRVSLLASVGVLIAAYAHYAFDDSVFLPWGQLFTVATILVMAKVCKDRLLAAVMVAPAILATIIYLQGSQAAPWSTAQDLILGVAMMLSLTLGAWWFSKEAKDRPHANFAWLDGLMHAATLLILFRGMERHVDASMHWVLMCATTCALAIAARRLPFPTLSWVAWLPSTLLLIKEYTTDQGLATSLPLYWIGSALLVLAWRITRPSHPLALGISAAAVITTVFLTFDGAAQVCALSFVALAYALLGRYRNERAAAYAAMITSTIAMFVAAGATVTADQAHAFAWILGTCVSVAFQGWLLKGLPTSATLWRDSIENVAPRGQRLTPPSVHLAHPNLWTEPDRHGLLGPREHRSLHGRTLRRAPRLSHDWLVRPPRLHCPDVRRGHR
ncbi:MAG: hypothetical protein ACI8T1_000036 [Verrucomicrobiales bacterium]|jgi:hypothetical protein